MSYQYDQYLIEHKRDVKKGFDWFQENLPDVLEDTKSLFQEDTELDYLIRFHHDESKTRPDEYDAYDAYFYGGNRSYQVCQEFNKAWLNHIHRNPHHWQHWVLINDDAEEGTIALDMPDLYILEMVCDWWSFSWKTGNLNEIFNWYDSHKERIIFSDETRKKVEDILDKMKAKLDD